MQLLEEVYPGLLDPSRPQKIEVFVPLNHKAVATDIAVPESEDQESSDQSSPLQQPASFNHSSPIRAATYPKSRYPSSPSHRFTGTTPPSAASSSSGQVQSETTHPSERSGATSPSILRLSGTTGSMGRQSGATPFSGQDSYLRKLSDTQLGSPPSATPPYSRAAKLSDHSWEVVSKFSGTSNCLSVLQDQSDPDYDLVPLWECLQVHYIAIKVTLGMAIIASNLLIHVRGS